MLDVKFALFDLDGKELNYEGYERMENNKKTFVYPLQGEPQLLFTNVKFPPYKGDGVSVGFIGLVLEGKIVRKSRFENVYKLRDGDILKTSYRLSLGFQKELA